MNDSLYDSLTSELLINDEHYWEKKYNELLKQVYPEIDSVDLKGMEDLEEYEEDGEVHLIVGKRCYEDEVVNLNGLDCPTSWQIQKIQERVKPVADAFVKMLMGCMPYVERIVLTEDMFSDNLEFCAVMDALGKAFKDIPTIEIDYQKPEVKDKDSELYGKVIAHLVVKNLAKEEERKQREENDKSIEKQMKQMKDRIANLSKIYQEAVDK